MIKRLVVEPKAERLLKKMFPRIKSVKVTLKYVGERKIEIFLTWKIKKVD